MLAKNIAAYEQKFMDTQTDAQGDKYVFNRIFSSPGIIANINPPGTGLAIVPIRAITGYFYPTETPKTMIVLHYTCGYLSGDIATLVEQDSHMSVSYVIGRNGTVFQLFDPKYWSYHLGKGSIGGNSPNSSRSIAIELSNIGPLTQRGSDLLTPYNDVYCNLGETQYYTVLNEPYRGYRYYASFTPQQYMGLTNLLGYLTQKFNIPRVFLPEKDRFLPFSNDPAAQTFKGICSHVNYRVDGKTDIGPAFDWNKIV